MSARPVRQRLVVGAVAALLALPAAAPAFAADDVPPSSGDPEIDVTVTVPELAEGGGDGGPAALTNAELRWGLNTEAISAAYYGGCNFLMAGTPGDGGNAGEGRPWEGAADADLYHAKAGAVRVLRTVGTGGSATQEQATYATRCDAPNGAKVTTGNGLTTAQEVAISGGRGERGPDGSLVVRWKGTFTVVFYGGYTYWWAADPVLRLDADGDGTLTATGGGYATSRDDMSKWERVRPTPITLATFSGWSRTSARGGVLMPDYCGVAVEVPTGGEPQDRDPGTAPCWGSFPQDFVDFHQRTGQSSYWYSSGGAADRRKEPTGVSVSYDATRSVGSAGSPGPPGGGGDATPTTGPGTPGNPGTTGGGTGGAGTTDGDLAGTGLGAAARGLGPAPTAATPGAAAAAFTAVAAETFGRGADPLVPDLLDRLGEDGDTVALLGAGLALTASAAVVGFRKRWLVLPFRG
ncbi:hypothetical protein GCM10009809_21060 [Isoptericola hypogeus]|uniref:Htaa protein n=1 Tax=Isoptericola hypogeus TaxID=300179 RepID=A0ABP4VFS1_9MICO